MTISEKIKLLRVQFDLTQNELAEKLNVSRTAVSKWELGNGVPNIDTIKDIAAYFKLSIDDLINDEYLIKGNLAVSGLNLYNKASTLNLIIYFIINVIISIVFDYVDSSFIKIFLLIMRLSTIGILIFIDIYVLPKKYLVKKKRRTLNKIYIALLVMFFVSLSIGVAIGLTS